VSGNGTIGVMALYLLFAWLISAAGAAWLTERKGYGERLGLMLGLILTVAGLAIALLLPGRRDSKWRRDGPFARKGSAARTTARK
jgi:fucose permease